MGVSETSSHEELSLAVANNPSIKPTCIAALAHAVERTDREELAAHLASLPKRAAQTQNPSTVIAILVKHGGMTESIEVDGEPYDGTLEDLRADESVPDDARIQYFVQTTENGARLAEELAPASQIARLFAEHPDRAEGLRTVLEFCDAPEGRSRDEIEACLFARPDILGSNPKTGGPNVYPAYFTTALEDAGAMQWNGTWKLTEEGRNFLSTGK